MARVTNAAITYDDANYMIANEGFTLVGTYTTGLNCLNKTEIIAYMNATQANFSAYATNRLVPYQLLAPDVDTTPPADITGLSCTNITDSFGTFPHSLATDNVAVSQLLWYNTAGTLIGVVNAGGTSFALTTLSAYTTYTMKLKAKDTSDNYSVNFSNTITFKTLPARVNPTLGSITNTSMIATWTNSTGTTSVDMYVWDNTTGTQVGSNIIGVSSPRSITGLTAGHSYTVFLRMNDSTNAINQTGEWGIGGATASTTTADTTPPSQVTGLGATGDITTWIDLAWDAATDNVGVTGYVWNWSYGNDIWNLGGTTTQLSYTFQAPDTNTLYYFRVQAYDAAGNYGDWSLPASAYSGGDVV